ncbi:MAG: PpiC domain-containing protein [Oscillospiraceae bacterium]|jgi:hypothetical protein
MKKAKQMAALLLAIIMLTTTAACSSDKSWAAKNDSLTVPIGSYIYYLFSAYSSASAQVSDSTKSVLEQQIDDKDATEWIREKALNSTKSLFVIDQKMKELNLSLSDEEQETIQSNTDSVWNSYQSMLEGYGIAKSSFELAATEYSVKYQKVFEATYGEGGPKEVSDDELKDFFEENYTDFSYVMRNLYRTDENGNFSALLSDEEKEKAEAEFDDYAAKINAGTMTLEQAAEAYQSVDSTASVENETINLNTTDFSDDLKTLLDGMEPGETKTAEISNGYLYILVTKGDITKKTEEILKDENSRINLLADYKAQEFSDEIAAQADSITGITLNEKAIDSYDPSMFESE